MTDFTQWADRVYRSQKLGSDVYLHGDPQPTPNQVAAVMHALADHTLNTHMVVAAERLGEDRAHLGTEWVLATGLGRYFQGLGDALETFD